MRLSVNMHLERRDGTRAPWQHVGRVDYPNDDVLALKLLGAPSIYEPPAKLGFKTGRPRQLSPEVAAALDRGEPPARICSVSLASLLELKWTSGGERTGWVSAEDYRRYMTLGAPAQ